MTARLAWVAVLALSIVPSYADEACEQDDDGLTNQLDRNIVFSNARTAEDFLNESLRHLFNGGFQGHRDLVMITSDLSVGEWGRFFLSLSSSFEYAFVMCNDIGQCAQGEIESFYSRMPNAAATDATNSVLDWIGGGELSVGAVFAPEFTRHDFVVSTGDGDEDSAEIFADTPRQIARNPDDYPVRSDDDPLVTDKRCRNNFGEVLEDQPELPTNMSGGSELPPTPDDPGYWIRVQTGWFCYPSETGVVCRRIYGYVWVEW